METKKRVIIFCTKLRPINDNMVYPSSIKFGAFGSFIHLLK